jgi:hypothetical protein
MLTYNQVKEYLNTIQGNSVNSILQAIENASYSKKHTTLKDFSQENEALQSLKLDHKCDRIPLF